MKKNFPLFKVHVDKQAAMDRISQMFDSGYINEGLEVAEFTTALQSYFNTEKLLLVNSCTSALTLAMKLAGVKPDTSVISTSMTCVATNCPIVTLGGKIIWADINPDQGCIDPNNVEILLRENPDVVAVVAVAWAGNPPDLGSLSSVCKTFDVKLILDAAHAFGSTYEEKQIHKWSDYTCYSLQAIKHITSGDGGILVCKSESDYEQAKQLKWFGIDRDHAKDNVGNWKGQHWDFDIKQAGFKFNMNNLTAALGLSQLPHIDKLLNKHIENANQYDYHFEDNEFIQSLIKAPGCSRSAHWVYTVRLNQPYNVHRDDLLFQLNDQGINAGVVHVPNHNYTCFEQFKNFLPCTDAFAYSQLSLPVGWWLEISDISHIAHTVLSICSRYKK